MEDSDDLATLLPLLEFVGPGVPDRDLARTVLSLLDRAFEASVFERVVLGLDGQMIVLRIGGRSFRQCPRDQHALVFESEVPVQGAGVMFLDDEGELVPAGAVAVGHRFAGVLRVPFGPIDVQAVVRGLR